MIGTYLPEASVLFDCPDRGADQFIILFGLGFWLRPAVGHVKALCFVVDSLTRHIVTMTFTTSGFGSSGLGGLSSSAGRGNLPATTRRQSSERAKCLFNVGRALATRFSLYSTPFWPKYVRWAWCSWHVG